MEAYQQAFDICGWQGIQCDNKIITSIKLPNNNLIGSLPKSFKNLKNLKQIDFSNNKLTNSIGQITQNLNTLKLNNNPLNESLDENRFKEKTNLVTLELENTNLSGIIPNSFGYSTGLATLNLSHNQLQGQIPESLTNLEHLQKLILNNNYLVGPLPALNKLSSSINNIDIRYNYIANLGGNTVVGNENSLKTDKLGNKISKYPQRQLIVAEKNFAGYSPIEKIEKIKI